MKPILLAFGNCQSLAMSAIARDLPTIADCYEILYLPSHPSLGNIEAEPDVPARCAVVWEQVGASQRLPFREQLPPEAKTIRFPELSLPLLWPMNCIDPRNQPDPPRHWGRFPYGDRLAIQLVEEGLVGEAGYDAWVERAGAVLPDLQRLFDVEMARAKRRSAEVDVEPMDLILDQWKTTRLFASFNHPSNEILWSMFLQLREASLPHLTIPEDEIAAAKQRFLNPVAGSGAVDMDWYQVVVHPLVAEKFDLAWCTEDTLHRCEVPGVDGRLTRRRFMAEYYMAPPPA